MSNIFFKPPRSNMKKRKSKTYYRWLKTLSYNERILLNLETRSIIDPITKCKLWQGGITQHFGHGKTSFHNKTISVHRLAMHLIKGFDLNSPNQILHKCKNHNCWEIEHLYEGNHDDNMRDKSNSILQCKYGHELSGYNLIIDKQGRRVCRKCKNRRRNETHRRRKQEKDLKKINS